MYKGEFKFPSPQRSQVYFRSFQNIYERKFSREKKREESFIDTGKTFFF